MKNHLYATKRKMLMLMLGDTSLHKNKDPINIVVEKQKYEQAVS